LQGLNVIVGWTQIEYQNKHYDIDLNDQGTSDDRRRNGGQLRFEDQGTENTPNSS